MLRAFAREPTHCFYETLKNEAVDPVHLILDLERYFSAAEATSEATLQQAREDTWGAIVRITEQLLSELCAMATFFLRMRHDHFRNKRLASLLSGHHVTRCPIPPEPSHMGTSPRVCH